MEQTSMVDWDFAAAVATRVAPSPPPMRQATISSVVAELHEGALRASGLVNDWCALGGEVGLAPVLVVDRSGWIRANAMTFSHLMDPVVEKVFEQGPGTGVTHAVGSRMAGLEVAGLLGYMSSKVLGQFDPFHGEHGRLLLVAPNVVKIEQELRVDPAVFRLWVCLHEEAHRVQFTAVPWLRDHVRGLITEVTDLVEPRELATPETIKKLVDSLKGDTSATGDGRPSQGLLEIFSSPQQREVLDRITGVMSLLEGHADVVMDEVGEIALGADVIREVRAKFNQRRAGIGALDRIVRRLLGMEAKAAQYRDGYRFVRTVMETVGKDGFNVVFAAPQNLPSKAEILEPQLWLDRMHPTEMGTLS